MIDTGIKYMVDRLPVVEAAQRLPPGCRDIIHAGLQRKYSFPKKHEPSGTNLFGAAQARQWSLHAGRSDGAALA
jgi:hypothetical protein